jgi:hypothetical protein
MKKSIAYEAEFIEHELREWAAMVDDNLRTQLSQKDIGITESMRRSLAYRILAASGSHKGQYQLIFHEYGRFVDMGAGRNGKGLQSERNKREAINRATGKNRRPKKWYSKTFYGSLTSLINRLVRNYSEFVVQHMKELEQNQQLQ